MALSDTGLLVRYCFDEGSGTTAGDSSGNSYDLTIDTGSGNLSWVGSAGAKGLESTSTTGTQRAARTISTSDLLLTSLHGQNQMTVEVVVRVDSISASNGRVFVINDTAGGNPRLGMTGTALSSMAAYYNGVGSEGFTLTSATKYVIHLVYDLTQATDDPRCKVYVNGTFNADIGAGVFTTQNQTLSIADAQELIAFNRQSSGSYDRSFDGALFYAAIYTGAFDATRVSDHYDVLIADDDPSGAAAPALDQEGFHFGVDDGSESAHTFYGAQDSNVTRQTGENVLIRALINGTGDPASAAYTLRYQKNGSGGYAAVPVGSGVAEAYSQPTWGAVGTAASGTTSCTPAYPTGISAATSHLFCFITGRSNTEANEPTMPAGWTQVGTLVGGTGTWAVDTGTRRVTVFRKDTTTGSETGTVTVSLAGTTANTMRAAIHRFEVPSGYLCEIEFVTGADTTNGTAYSATASANATFDSDRLLVTVTAQNIDTGTATSRAVSASGITFGTLTNRADTAVTNGNDHRHIINTIPVDSGSGTVAPTYSYTISASGSGPTGFLVMRGRLPAVVNELYVSPSSNITAGGEATTARLTAPSGKTTGDFVTGRRWDDENGTDSIDLTTDDYTEVEWCLRAQSPATNGDYYEFRVYAGASALDTYGVTPRWTIGTPATPSSIPRGYRAAAFHLAALMGY